MTIRPILVALCALLPALASAAPPTVVAGSLVHKDSGSQATSMTVPGPTIPAGTDQMLVVCLSTERGSAAASASNVHIGTNSNLTLTKEATSQWFNFAKTQMWTLQNPAAGASSISITLDNQAWLQVVAFLVSGTNSITQTAKYESPYGGAWDHTLNFATPQADDSLSISCASTATWTSYGIPAQFLLGQTALDSFPPYPGGPWAAQMTVATQRVGPGGFYYKHQVDRDQQQDVAAEFQATIPGGGGGPGDCSCTGESFIPANTAYQVVECDGTTDATAAIQSAIRTAAARPGVEGGGVVLKGSCPVSAQILTRKANGTWLDAIGIYAEKPGDAEIFLKPNSTGFSDPNNPRGVLFFSSKVECGNSSCSELPEWQSFGGGNKGFGNRLWDVNIRVGTGNPGAACVDWLASNWGSIRGMKCTFEGTSGSAGIMAKRYGPGPTLWRDLVVEGGQRCLDVAAFDFSVTGERIVCKHQAVEAVRNSGNSLTLRNLTTMGPHQALNNATADSFMAVTDSTFTDGDSATIAVANSGHLALQNVTCSGYSECLSGQASPVAFYASDTVQHSFAADNAAPLAMTIKETPRVKHSLDPRNYMNASLFATTGDIGPALNLAIATGRPEIYTANGSYTLASAVVVPESVRVLDFQGSVLTATTATPSAVLKVQGGSASSKPLVIRRFWATSSFWGRNVIEVDSPRTVIVESMTTGGNGRVLVKSSAGEVYLEDVSSLLTMEPGTHVWARQLNPEAFIGMGRYAIENHGGALYVLGGKTEGGGGASLTDQGGCTRWDGGLVYPVEPVATGKAMHIVSDARASFLHAGTSYSTQARYPVVLRETRSGITQELADGAFPRRGLGPAVMASAQQGACSI